MQHSVVKRPEGAKGLVVITLPERHVGRLNTGGLIMTRSVQRLCVAVCTRRRPRMLADLMDSMLQMDVPQGSEMHFIFVENDEILSIEEAVSSFRKRSGWSAEAVHMPRKGLSHARNAALDAAIAAKGDWLAFVDDDEQVRHDWLRLLWTGARAQAAHLAGGPLKPVAPKAGCSDDQARVLQYYVQAALVSDGRKEAAYRAGRRFDLATNNWIANLTALQSKGLRFDETFNVSGGEDTDLSRRAHAAGLVLGWVPTAVVTEEVPAERLTPRYIFDRARAQTITKLQLRKASRPTGAYLSGVGQMLSKLISGGFRVAISPMAGSYSYYRGLRALGIASGFRAALMGESQAQYSDVTGE